MDETDEVVISGAAGAFPECKNIPELEKALFGKVHLVTDDDRKWKEEYDFPTYCGKAFSHEYFDAIFFTVPFSHPVAMDTITKRCLETSIEAVIDAGVHPKSLSGTLTAVYATYEFSETELTMGSSQYTNKISFLIGAARTLTANRISFAMNLHGPSYTVQGSYGATFYLINHAKTLMERGAITGAVIVCANYLLTSRSLAILDGMGLAAKDGKCRPFDRNAQGYALSDGCVALFLQRKSDAKRQWATVIGVDHRFFGTKQDSILSFDGEPARQMLRQLYAKCKVDPAKVSYIEADGSGIKEQDVEEVNVISDVFCKNRDEPMLIGSLKSNMGHAQSAACGAGIVKALIALNRAVVPPNIHLSSPIPELAAKHVTVATESTPIRGNLVAVNTLGFGGYFGHILLKKNPIIASSKKIDDSIPQILLLSSRTEKGLNEILEHAQQHNLTPEFAGLLNGVFWRELKAHMFKSYSLIASDGSVIQQKTKKVEESRRPIWWVFSGMGSQWNGMGSQLRHIPIFREAIDKCAKVLKPHGVDLWHILTTDDKSIFENILNAFVGITAVQIGLVEILRALQLEPDGILGHSLGELGCAYADNCLTLEQTILATHARGRASLESELMKGMMAAIGMGTKEIISKLPPTVDVACQNSDSSCTISGPVPDVEKFVDELKSQGVFAKTVNVGNIAYHSRYIQPAAPLLYKYLKEIIPTNTRRSKKWVCSSALEEHWDSKVATESSPEYHTNNLLNPVYFETALKYIPPNAVLIEIAPHGLLQAILKRAVPKTNTNIPLTHRASPDAVKFLLEAIGETYLQGCEPNVLALYPPMEYPVPCDTPSLQPFVTWDHSEKYELPPFLQFGKKSTLALSEQLISFADVQNLLNSYETEDTPVLPLSIFLVEVWKIFVAVRKKRIEKTPVTFENIRVYSEINSSFDDQCDVYMSVMHESGEFTVNQVFTRIQEDVVTENETVLVRGRITDLQNLQREISPFETVSKTKEGRSEDASDECFVDLLDSSNFGLLISKGISDVRACSQGLCGKIKWSQEWVRHLDAIIRLNLLVDKPSTDFDDPLHPSLIRFIHLNTKQLEAKKLGSKIEFFIDPVLHQFESDGAVLWNMKTEHKKKDNTVVENITFLPYGETYFSTQHEFATACVQVIAETVAACESSTPVKISLYKLQHNQTVERILGMLENASNPKDEEDLNIEFVPGNFNCNDESSEVCLSISSDSKAVSQLSWMKHFEHQFVLVVFYNGDKLAGDVSPYGKNYVNIYKQVFGSKKLGFFRRINPDGKPLKCLNYSWRSNLESLKTEITLANETVLLSISGPSPANPLRLIQEVLKKISARKVRIFLTLDDDAPAFSVNNKIYAEQIDKEMVVNVLKKGRWGCYRKREISKTTLKNVLPIVTLGANASSEVDILYIGLDVADLDEKPEGESAVLEYSGVTNSNDHVMGLACRNCEFDGKIELDPIFQWRVPSSITLEEAASLPFAYLMASLVIRDGLDRGPDQKKVLILNGHTPVGVACISVALNQRHIVYTTVPNDAAEECVKRAFPQIHIYQRSNHNSRTFLVPFMIATEGLGADLVISDLPQEEIFESWACVGKWGSFYNLNGEVIRRNALLPMRKFLACTSFFSFTKADLVALTPDRKRRLHSLVDDFFKSGRISKIPAQVLSANEVKFGLNHLKPNSKTGQKILLKLREMKRHGIIDRDKLDRHKFDPLDCQGSFVILSSTVSKSLNIIKWLLKNGAKNIVLAPTSQTRNTKGAREIQDWIARFNATILISSGTNVHLPHVAKDLLRKASKIGEISAILLVSVGQNTNLLETFRQVARDQNVPGLLINIADKDSSYVPDVLSVICDGNVSSWDILGHALVNLQDKSATYVLTDKSNDQEQSLSGQNEILVDQMTDYLPSSVKELEEMGEVLSLKDLNCDSDTLAKFILTPTLAPLGVLHKDLRPVFIIPAFCETDLRPLISKMLYPCFIAHFHPDVPSMNQAAIQLLKSMTSIQKKGPYTIVAETWSGGLGMTLSRLVSDTGHEVALFLLQGVPKKLKTLLPPIDEPLSQYLLNILFKEEKQDFQDNDEHMDLEDILRRSANIHSKTHVARAFNAILKSLEFAMNWKYGTKQKDTLILMEVGRLCKLTENDIDSMSEKKVRLVKSEAESYKAMLSDPHIHATIAEEALFSWSGY